MKRFANASGIQSPCLGCADRQVGCHSICAKYIDFQERNEKKNQEIRDAKAASSVLNSYNKNKEAGLKTSKYRKRGV